jgi:hypothetical protein
MRQSPSKQTTQVSEGQTPEQLGHGRHSVHDHQESIDDRLGKIANAQDEQHNEFRLWAQRVDDWNCRVEAQIFDKSTGDSKIVKARECAEEAHRLATQACDAILNLSKSIELKLDKLAGRSQWLLGTVVMLLLAAITAFGMWHNSILRLSDRMNIEQATTQEQTRRIP